VSMRARLPKGILRRIPPHTHAFPHTLSKSELAYRRWTVARRLFLTPLNEIQEDALSARDPLALPTITTSLDAEFPKILGFFSQLKQEYATARFCYYQGVTSVRPHFSDRDVVLIDTQDYPAYGLASEHLKIAFRLAYSLFDKIANLLNEYLKLGVPDKKTSFRTIWYTNQDAGRGIREDVHRPANTALMALFWIAKDLYEREEGFTRALEPDARELAEIRHHLEHKYLRLQLFGSPARVDNAHNASPYSIGLADFERRCQRLLRLARSALIYVSAAVYVEEAGRNRGVKRKGVSVPVFVFKDELKV